MSLEATLPYLIRYSYLGVFALILLASTVLPFSKTFVIIGAGVLASQGIGSLPAYLLVSVAGLLAADALYYGLGYIAGDRILRWRIFSGARNRDRFREAETRFRRHDWVAVFSARFLPFLRTAVFIVAGLGRMPPVRFLSADLLSACVFVPLAVFLGYLSSENREAIIGWVKRGEYALALIVFLALVILFLVPGRPKRG